MSENCPAVERHLQRHLQYPLKETVFIPCSRCPGPGYHKIKPAPAVADPIYLTPEEAGHVTLAPADVDALKVRIAADAVLEERSRVAALAPPTPVRVRKEIIRDEHGRITSMIETPEYE